MELIRIHLGTIAFNNLSFKHTENQENTFSNIYVPKFHPTIFEAITSAFIYAIDHTNINNWDSNYLKQSHLNLLNDDDFKDSISNRTTNLDNIKKRISLATKYLFGLNYEWK